VDVAGQYRQVLDVSTMSIHRYVNDKKYTHLNFPKPSVIVDRCYWDRAEIDAWMRSRAVSSRKGKSKAVA
jgi:predicted DNA-binding transcriptional regulator AlpA